MSEAAWLAKVKGRRAAGLCPKCGATPVPGRVQCAKHLTIDKRAAAACHAKALAAGRCPLCKKRAPAPGKKTCARCLEYQRDYYRRVAKPGRAAAKK